MKHFIELNYNMLAIVEYWHQSTFKADDEQKYYALQKVSHESLEKMQEFRAIADKHFPLKTFIKSIQFLKSTNYTETPGHEAPAGLLINAEILEKLNIGIAELKKSVATLTETLENGLIDKNN